MPYRFLWKVVPGFQKLSTVLEDKHTGWQGHTDFDKLSSDKSLVVVNTSLMRNDKYSVREGEGSI